MSGHADVTDLPVLAGELLTEARSQHAKRAARTLVAGTVQRATLIALAEGAEVTEHRAPAAATLYVVTGRVTLRTHGQEWDLGEGKLAHLPPQRHGLQAVTDAVVLLTVALH
jgi:quercetin dioxygenase-like cupin family protein